MTRWLCFLLVAANLGLAAYHWLQWYYSPLHQYQQQQIAPEKLQFFSFAEYQRLQDNAFHTAAVPQKTGTETIQNCWQWAPLTEAEKTQITERFPETLSWNAERNQALSTWWVHLAPAPNKAATDQKIRQLKKLGIQDWYLITESGPYKNTISLGLFRSEEGAKTLAGTLEKQGLGSIQITEREPTLKSYTLKFSGLVPLQINKLQELYQMFPIGELKTIACP